MNQKTISRNMHIVSAVVKITGITPYVINIRDNEVVIQAKYDSDVVKKMLKKGFSVNFEENGYVMGVRGRIIIILT